MFLYFIFMLGVSLSQANLPPIWVNNMNYERINEGVAVGEVIYTLYGTDEEGVQCVYGIREMGIPFFTVDPVSGNVSLVRPLDREKQSQHDMTVTLSDGVNTVYDDIIILVEDSNDNPPHFINTPYTCDVPETTIEGSNIFQVVATDPDLGPAGSVFYSLELIDDDQGIFSIDTNTGWITLTKPLTSELSGIHVLKVTAKDGGQILNEDFTTQQSTVTLAVNVMDDRAQVLTVYENEPPGTTVGIVNRIYTPYTGSVYYFIKDSSEFTLESQTRKLTTKLSLDREKISSYKLTIFATDNPFPQPEVFLKNSSTFDKNVIVEVKDVNDNPPYFIEQNYIAGVMVSTSRNNSSIVDLKFNDVDEESNNYFLIDRMEYTSVDKSTTLNTSIFEIDSITGDLSLSTIIGTEWLGGYFKLIVRITDEKFVTWTDSASIYINILSEAEVIKIIFNKRKEDVQEKLQQFLNLLADIVKNKIVVDDITIHETSSGKLIESKTDLLLHAVNMTSYTVMRNDDVISVIDGSNTAIQKLLTDFHVITIEKYKMIESEIEEPQKEFLRAGMATLLAACIIIIAVLSAIIYFIRKRYRTKLKAATASLSTGLNTDILDGSFRKMSSEVLGTNKYSTEGGKYQPLFDGNFVEFSPKLQPAKHDKSPIATTFNWSDINHIVGPTTDSLKYDSAVVSSDDESTSGSQIILISNTENQENILKLKKNYDAIKMLKNSYDPRGHSSWIKSKLIRRQQLENAYNQLNGDTKDSKGSIDVKQQFTLRSSTKDYGSTRAGSHLQQFNLDTHVASLKGRTKLQKSNPVWNLSGSIPVEKMNISADDVIVDVKDDELIKSSEVNPNLSLNEEVSKEVAESLYSRITNNISASNKSRIKSCNKISKRKKGKTKKKKIAKNSAAVAIVTDEPAVCETKMHAEDDDITMGRLHGGCDDEKANTTHDNTNSTTA